MQNAYLGLCENATEVELATNPCGGIWIWSSAFGYERFFFVQIETDIEILYILKIKSLIQQLLPSRGIDTAPE